MRSGSKQVGFRRRVRASVAFALCLVTLPAFAQTLWTAAELLKPEQAHFNFHPIPLAHRSNDGGLSFDLGDTTDRKLQLRLAEPLLIGPAFGTSPLNLAGSGFIAGGSLEWPAANHLSVEFNTSRSAFGSPFQPLGSIHCENGVLAPDSYTASECYFIDRPQTAQLDTFSLGTRYRLSDTASAAISLFRREADAFDVLSPDNVPLPFTGLAINQATQMLSGLPLEPLHSEVSGIDLEFQVGVSTDRAGDLQVGLQLTRVLDASYEGFLNQGTGLGSWVLDGPSDSARLSFDWHKGAFSGGVQSYYRAPIEFLNRSELDSRTTFDVHFTWRTPWNANLSVGASNVLSSGSEDANTPDNALTDPFESVYGRIPYVRYQQDL